MDFNDPTSWKQMQRYPDRDDFMAIVRIEFSGLQDRSAWEVMNMNDIPENSQIFSMR